MVRLNLPSFDYRLSEEETKVRIFDIIRKKYVVLTPEEWVRQHFIHYLILRGYPKALIRIEGGLHYNHLSRRTDIVVHNRRGSPYMVIECKSPDQVIDRKVLQQVSTYNTTIRAPYMVVTNGLQHYYFKCDWMLRKNSVLKDLPAFDADGTD